MNRMQADIEHFRAKLDKIDGAGDLGDKLLELVQAKPIAAAASEAEKPEPASETKDQDQDQGSESTES